jgi:PAS domain S-box-containing protein
MPKKDSRSREELLAENRRLRDTLSLSEFQLENVNSVILRWRSDGEILYINRFGEDLFGFSRDELIGRSVIGSIVPETEDSGRDLKFMMQDIAKNPENYLDNENENTCKDGSRVWVLWRNKPIHGEDGSLREILSVGADITKRKTAERELSRQLSFNQALVDSIPNPIFVKGPDTRFITFNRAYEEAFGIRRDKYIGKTVLDLDYIPEEAREHFQQEDTALLRTGGVKHVELNLTYADGAPHTVLYWVASFDTADGERAGLLGLFVDVSEQKRLEHDLEGALKVSSPIIKIWEGVLLAPIVGIVDHTRAQHIMDATLAMIAETRAKRLILDISGVANVDEQVAASLTRVTKAAALMGCASTISGVSPDVARTIVELGVEIGRVGTTASLGDAIGQVFRAIGLR